MPSLPFRWFAPTAISRPASPIYNVVNYDDDDEDDSDDDRSPTDRDDPPTLLGLGSFSLARRSSSQSHLLLPRIPSFGGSSQYTSAANSPLPSRSSSPAPPLFSTPLYTSTSEDEPPSPLFLGNRRRKWWPRRRKHETGIRSIRGWKRTAYRILKHPLFPTQPLTILLTLLLFTTFALLLTVSLIYILNPDKYALPWRQYCSHRTAAAFPPPDFETLPPAGLFVGVFSMDAAVERRMLVRTTWASHLRSRGMDGATDRTVVRFVLGKPRPEWERRVGLEMQTYNDIIVLPMSENMNNGKTHAFFTWAHENALVPPSNTNHTFNPVHRLPTAPKVPVVVPVPEVDETSSSSLSTSSSTDATSLASASTSTSSTEAATETAEPEEPHLPSEAIGGQEAATSSPTPIVRRTGAPPSIRALHDPRPPRHLAPSHRNSHNNRRRGLATRKQRDIGTETWVAPDFVIKADDDSFVMLAELEGRLRVEWAEAMKDAIAAGKAVLDPLIFWGYLVKSRFMAGELYALSSGLVSYIATNPRLLSMTRGAEDKTTSKWIRLHPQADQVRWRSEHCWIYDHPRAGTVYSHGYLFPSEADRVGAAVEQAKELLKNATAAAASSKSWIGSSTSLKPEVAALMTDAGLVALSTTSSGSTSTTDDDTSTVPVIKTPTSSWDPDSWQPGPPEPASTPLPPSSPFLSHSSVSRFGTRYTFPVSNLSIPMQVEALVEGSGISRLTNTTGSTDGGVLKWEKVMGAWETRETYDQRYARSTLRARGIRDPSSIRPPSVEDVDEEPESESLYGPRGIGLGGTVVVHFIKKNEWFLETAMALLGPSVNGDEGRIDPGTEKPLAGAGAEAGSTIVAKTQSFKRSTDADEMEAS